MTLTLDPNGSEPIPDDVMKAAEVVALNIPQTVRAENRKFAAIVIARAIMAERERCASVAEQHILLYATSSRDWDVSLQGAAKEEAAAEIAKAIRGGKAAA